MREPNWIPSTAVRAIHQELIAEHGGLPGVRDQNLLESALARPKNLWAYEDPNMFDLAAAYGFGLAKNHPFLDGNKRVALAAISVFLEINHYQLVADEAQAVEVILGLAGGAVSQKELSRWMQRHTRKAAG